VIRPKGFGPGDPPKGAGWARRTGRLPAQSTKRKADKARREAVREAVFLRDGYLCRLSPYRSLNQEGRDWGPCFGVPLTFHHLIKASHPLGTYTEENGTTLCSGHNDMIEDWPKEAEAIGLVIRPEEGSRP
jgi:5-methylcytosine-specific restriction endonuclease McrA